MYAHQQEAFEHLLASDPIGALGCEMGTGKSRVILEIAARKFKQQ
jgi:hypothetical protein